MKEKLFRTVMKFDQISMVLHCFSVMVWSSTLQFSPTLAGRMHLSNCSRFCLYLCKVYMGFTSGLRGERSA